MGLYSILKKIKEESREVRLLILGLDNAGKTTILKSITGEDVTTVAPTLGFNIKTVQYRDYNLNFWDVGGQTSLRAYWRNYFESTDALIWVVDSVDRMRLADCRAELAKLLQEERLFGATLLVLANKQDIDGAMTVGEIADSLRLEQIKSHHWRVFDCSAVASSGVWPGIDWMINDIGARIFSLQ